MTKRVTKRKHFELYREPLDLKLALSLLSVFSLIVAMYLVASCGRLVSSIAVSIESPAAAVTRGFETDVSEGSADMIKFLSQDDFKSYMDDGKRLYGDGIFEAEGLAPLAQAGKEVLSAAAAKTAKAGLPITMDMETERRYFSLRSGFDGSRPDIAQIGKTNFYFSPENQYYAGAFASANNTSDLLGQTMAVSAFPADRMALIDTIPADGNLLFADSSLVIFLGNSIVAYNSDSVFGRQEMWRDRINEGSEIIGARLVNGKLYLAIKSVIDDSNPCPIKPITAGDQSYLVKCDNIYHPKDAMLADSVVTAVQLSPLTGKIENSLSYIAQEEEATVLFTEEGIFALWGEGGDYISFFSDFLNEKCKSLLPNYILEKAQKLGGYNISLLAKEMELRSIIMNWLATLDEAEQVRIKGEIAVRLGDYLGGNFKPFERTRVAAIDAESFIFSTTITIPGLISDPSFVDVSDGYLRVATVLGSGAEKKINWLVSGQAVAEAAGEAVNGIYVLDMELEVTASQMLNIAGEICAIRYADDIAYASACSGSSIYVINLALEENVGLASTLDAGGGDFYIYPMENRQLLVISRNKRNITLAIFDNELATRAAKKSEYVLNDYWTDFDGNYRSFSADDENSLFFVPAGKGGYVFFHNNGKIELQKGVGNAVPSRTYLRGGILYILSESGIEAFGAPEWSLMGELVF